MNIADIRKEYTRGGLSRCDAPAEPLELFASWLADAVSSDQIAEPTAMVVGTVCGECRPSLRTVLLKELRGGQFVFFTHYESRKGGQITANPNVALSFMWYPLERQVHIEGIAARLPASESDAYFHSRPLGSRLGTIVSPQSRVIPNRFGLLRAYEQLHQEVETSERPVERPEHWGGIAVTPLRIEFWQGRENRLHDRLLYTLLQPEGIWSLERLAP